MEDELGRDCDLLQVPSGDPVPDLYNESHRESKSAGQKTAKNKAIFPSGQALVKQVCLAIEGASRKWIFRHREWPVIYSQLMIYFGDRLAERVLIQKGSLHRKPYTPPTKEPVQSAGLRASEGAWL